MNNKSYLLLILLIIVLAFILGFRSGQKVEKTNKVVNYILSITPTKIPLTPTPISYKEYKSKKWGLKFIYPAGLEVKESASMPAVLFEVKKLTL